MDTAGAAGHLLRLLGLGFEADGEGFALRSCRRWEGDGWSLRREPVAGGAHRGLFLRRRTGERTEPAADLVGLACLLIGVLQRRPEGS